MNGRYFLKNLRNPPSASDDRRKGTPRPAEYPNSNAMPCCTVLSLLARVKIDPRIGPTQGVQPIANVRPTRYEPRKPAGLFRTWSCFVRENIPTRRMPARYSPNTMRRAPPAIRIQSRYSRRNWPAAQSDAPRITNTVVNPAMKAIEWSRTVLRAPDASLVSWSTDMPVMKDKYDGKRGRTHGDRNENN